MADGNAAHNATIVKYFNLSGFDYQLLWSNRHNRAWHYGYWDAQTRSHRESLTNMNRELAQPLGLKPGQRVLDAGCGVGGSSFWLAETFGVQVLGITLSAKQVRTAARLAERRKLSHLVQFAVADYCATGLDAGSFDVVWAQESVCYALDKLDFLREAARLLRPGGKLAIEDGWRTRRDLPNEEERRLRQTFSRWAVDDFSVPAEFEAQAKEAGFASVVFRDVTENAYPSAKRLNRIATTFRVPELIAYRLRLRPEAVHKNFLGALEQLRTLDEGLCTMQLMYAVKP